MSKKIHSNKMMSKIGTIWAAGKRTNAAKLVTLLSITITQFDCVWAIKKMVKHSRDKRLPVSTMWALAESEHGGDYPAYMSDKAMWLDLGV